MTDETTGWGYSLGHELEQVYSGCSTKHERIYQKDVSGTEFTKASYFRDASSVTSRRQPLKRNVQTILIPL